MSKNIPHLQLEKKNSKKLLNISQIESLAKSLKIPSTEVYQLQTEYESLKEMVNDAENEDLQVLGGRKVKGKTDQEVEETKNLLQAGLPVDVVFTNFQPLKEKHLQIKQRIMNALGHKKTIDWDGYLKMHAILKYYSASRDEFIDFWIKFFNPYNQPSLKKEEITENIELLSRGCFTASSTLVSENFAQGFYQMLKDKGCTQGDSNIDMVAFKKKLYDGQIDVNYLNDCMK